MLKPQSLVLLPKLFPSKYELQIFIIAISSAISIIVSQMNLVLASYEGQDGPTGRPAAKLAGGAQCEAAIWFRTA